MISGFNTDVEFAGTVYHVQTEDKGLPKRMIMSLVYDGGTILASKRVSYDDLTMANFEEMSVAERVSRQHKLICAAVRAGRLDELKKMSSRSAVSPAPSKTKAAAPAFHAPVARGGIPQIINVNVPELFADPPIFDPVKAIGENEIFPAEAVEVVTELSGQERSSNTKLSLELLGDTKFKGGDRRIVSIMICRGTQRKVVGNAQMMIKVLGSSFRPVIFHAKSDENGLASVHLQLPQFKAGRAAILVRAMTGGEEIELRKVVTPG